MKLLLLAFACSNGGLWPRIPGASEDSRAQVDDSAPRQDLVLLDAAELVIASDGQRNWEPAQFETQGEARWTHIQVELPVVDDTYSSLFRTPDGGSCGLLVAQEWGLTGGESWVLLEADTDYELVVYGPLDETIVVTVTQPAEVDSFITEMDCAMVFPDTCACQGGIEGLCNCAPWDR